MRKYSFICLLGFVASQAMALSLELNSSASELTYRATKYGSMIVEGKLSAEARNSLEGTLLVQDLELASDLKGRIVLKYPRFESDSFRRDDEVEQIITSAVEVEILDVLSYTPGTGVLRFMANMSLNGYSKVHELSAQLMQREEGIKVSGVISIDRQFYGLVFSGFAGTFDVAIQNAIALHYELLFDSEEPDKKKLFKAIPSQLVDQSPDSIEHSAWERLKKKLLEWLESSH